jgi:sigma-B regulation protein RsbU (phosphoserine phosphatase)
MELNKAAAIPFPETSARTAIHSTELSYVLGMFDFASYQSRTFALDPGDILVVYSDGLTDAENPRNEMFGEERLLQIIQREAPHGGHAVEQKLLRTIDEFTQGTPQTDDITFVVVEKCR